MSVRQLTVMMPLRSVVTVEMPLTLAEVDLLVVRVRLKR